MPRNVWHVCCELENKTTQQHYKIPAPCLDDHQFNEEKIGICWVIVTGMFSNCLNCLYVARIGTPGILWSVNKLARNDHKMDQSL